MPTFAPGENSGAQALTLFIQWDVAIAHGEVNCRGTFEFAQFLQEISNSGEWVRFSCQASVELPELSQNSDISFFVG